MAKVGFIGLGIMGAPMALNLQKGGHTLYVYDIKTPPAELTSGGATACKSNTKITKQTNNNNTKEPDTPHVEAALFGENGVAAGLSKGKIVVDMSSISPIANKGFAKKINE